MQKYVPLANINLVICMVNNGYLGPGNNTDTQNRQGVVGGNSMNRYKQPFQGQVAYKGPVFSGFFEFQVIIDSTFVHLRPSEENCPKPLRSNSEPILTAKHDFKDDLSPIFRRPDHGKRC